ncbi:MAG TPA: hypothetical protein VF647_08120 [Longimicrobium sp.]|jgi:hypothetical protein
MPFNVLLLPLLGGYFFITRWLPTRFATKRYTGERLLFHAAAAGLAWLAIAFVGVTLLDSRDPSLGAEWKKLIPFPYAGTSLLAFLGGALGWWPLNLLLRLVGRTRNHYARAAMETWGDYLEILMEDSIQRSLPVAVTLKNGKVYIGWVLQNFDPAYERKYLRLLPSDSGYRDPATHELNLTTHYSPVLQDVLRRLNEAEAARPNVVDRPPPVEPEDGPVGLGVLRALSRGRNDAVGGRYAPRTGAAPASCS